MNLLLSLKLSEFEFWYRTFFYEFTDKLKV